jgi:hypothetical protein
MPRTLKQLCNTTYNTVMKYREPTPRKLKDRFDENCTENSAALRTETPGIYIADTID